MKKFSISVLVLLNSAILNAMSGQDISTINKQKITQDKINRHIKQFDLLDSAIKENISINDPKAFQKIGRYAEILLARLEMLETQEQAMLSKNLLSAKEFQDLKDSKQLFAIIKSEFPKLKNPNSDELSAENDSSFDSSIEPAAAAAFIAQWNVLKTFAIAAIDIMRKAQSAKLI